MEEREKQRQQTAAVILAALIGKRNFPDINDSGMVGFLTELAVAYTDELTKKLRDNGKRHD